MQAEDIRRLRSTEDDHKFNIKARAADELLTSIYNTLNKAENEIDSMLTEKYSDEQNSKLMNYLTLLRGVEKVVNRLNSI